MEFIDFIDRLMSEVLLPHTTSTFGVVENFDHYGRRWQKVALRKRVVLRALPSLVNVLYQL